MEWCVATFDRWIGVKPVLTGYCVDRLWSNTMSVCVCVQEMFVFRKLCVFVKSVVFVFLHGVMTDF